MPSARHAERLAHDDRAPGVRRLVYRSERPYALADRPLLLGAPAYEEPRIIDEIHQGQAKRIAKVNEARHFLRRRRVDSTGVKRGVVRHHPDRYSVQPCEARDERRTE